MAVPPTPHYRDALRRGDTLSRRPCVHWADKKLDWIRHQKGAGARVLGVELADDATHLLELRPARQLTVVLLGHERSGIPDEAWELLDEVVEIPMIGTGSSLNVAVAGSLVLYKLAGLS